MREFPHDCGTVDNSDKYNVVFNVLLHLAKKHETILKENLQKHSFFTSYVNVIHQVA